MAALAGLGLLLCLGSAIGLIAVSELNDVAMYVYILLGIGVLLGAGLGFTGMILDLKRNPPKPPEERVERRPLFVRRVPPQVVKTRLMAVNGVNQTYRSGTISGALVGGLLAGDVGAIVGGIANTKDHTYNVDTEYTFLVLYDNGENSWRQ